jgi:molybdopterin-binding protein
MSARNQLRAEVNELTPGNVLTVIAFIDSSPGKAM